MKWKSGIEELVKQDIKRVFQCCLDLAWEAGSAKGVPVAWWLGKAGKGWWREQRKDKLEERPLRLAIASPRCCHGITTSAPSHVKPAAQVATRVSLPGKQEAPVRMKIKWN